MPRFGKCQKKPEYVTVGKYTRLTIDIMSGVIHLETPQEKSNKKEGRDHAKTHLRGGETSPIRKAQR
jgi:hypothetical protein